MTLPLRSMIQPENKSLLNYPLGNDHISHMGKKENHRLKSALVWDMSISRRVRLAKPFPKHRLVFIQTSCAKDSMPARHRVANTVSRQITIRNLNILIQTQMRRMYGLFTYMKDEKWPHSRGDVGKYSRHGASGKHSMY